MIVDDHSIMRDGLQEMLDDLMTSMSWVRPGMAMKL